MSLVNEFLKQPKELLRQHAVDYLMRKDVPATCGLGMMQAALGEIYDLLERQAQEIDILRQTCRDHTDEISMLTDLVNETSKDLAIHLNKEYNEHGISTH